MTRVSGCHTQQPTEVVEAEGVSEATVQVCYQQPQQMGIEMGGGGHTLIPRRFVASPQGLVTAIPFYNVVIPTMDNYVTPVNTSVAPSVDPNGTDLPLHGEQFSPSSDFYK